MPDARTVIVGIGIGVVLMAAGRSVQLLHGGAAAISAIYEFAMIGAFGVGLALGGYYLRTVAVDRSLHSRVAGWVVGGMIVMTGVVAMLELRPGASVSRLAFTLLLAIGIGSVGGLFIGLNETRAISREREAREAHRSVAEAADRLERTNERLEQFAGIVSHDLRNPLNVARGRVDIARMEDDTEELDVAIRALDRMETMIDDLLTLSLEGQTVDEPEPVVLADLARACWTTVSTTDATLTVETDARIVADPGRCRELFENCFRNAVEHGGNGVTVVVGDLPEGAGFYVADDGRGIPPDERERVFESGYSTSEDGTGLGLTIVKQIAEAHGWEVAVTEAEDGGARFEFTGVTFASP